MSNHFVYIIYSESLDAFYIGETADLDERLRLHKTGFFKRSYTASADDWELFLTIECEDRSVARNIERHIKRNKSRTYIRNLKAYPGIKERLREQYTSRGSQSRYSYGKIKFG